MREHEKCNYKNNSGERECGQDMALLYCDKETECDLDLPYAWGTGWIELSKTVLVFSSGRTPESPALFHDDAFFEDEDVPLADLDQQPLSAHRPCCENIAISSEDL